MAFNRKSPSSFGSALDVVREILSGNNDLVEKQLVQTESEMIVVHAHRQCSGEQLSRVQLYSRLREPILPEVGHTAMVFAGARAEGRTLQHVLGYQTFLDHEYEVSRDVLVPRPETEMLASLAISALSQGPASRLGLEVGIGSGVLSIEILCRFPELEMVASEVSDPARMIAEKNAERILGEAKKRLTIVRPESPQEVLRPFERELAGRKADFLIMNPPYLASSDDIDREVLQNEPHVALFPESDDPLLFYRAVASAGHGVLRDGARCFAELSCDRADQTAKIFRDQAWSVEVHEDLAGRPRVLFAQLRRSGHG